VREEEYVPGSELSDSGCRVSGALREGAGGSAGLQLVSDNRREPGDHELHLKCENRSSIGGDAPFTLMAR